jgi:hypothetical protein
MNEQVPHEIPAGWYPDPDGKPADRYWNGNAWGTETRPSMAGPSVTGWIADRFAGLTAPNNCSVPPPRALITVE